MAFDLFARFLEIAGQSAGRCCQQPEQKKSNTVGAHAADFRLSRYHHQINRVESGKKQASGYTGGKKGWPEHCDNTLYDRYICPAPFHGGIDCGFHGLCPRR
jgi:hypothetical protein